MCSAAPELKWAVRRGNVDKVRELIKQGVDLDYLKDYGQKLGRSPMTQNHVEIVRLFLNAGAKIDKKLVKEFLKDPCSQYAVELFSIILSTHLDIELLFCIYEKILWFSDRPKAVEILKLLLDSGLSVNELYEDEVSSIFLGARSPFHMAIERSKVDFVRNVRFLFIVFQHKIFLIRYVNYF